MAIHTASGQDSGTVGGHGVPTLGNTVLTATILNNLNIDLLSTLKALCLSGVVAGGVCTVSGLTVTIPSGTTYYAEMLWSLTSNATVSVVNGTTVYIWGCSDGVIRTTTSTTPPTSFTTSTACIIAKATASGFVVTLDATAQQQTRYADPSARTVRDGVLTIGQTSVQIGGGAGVKAVLSTTATLDFSSTSAQSYSTRTLTLTGARDGDTVIVTPPNASVPNGGTFNAWVSADDTVSVRFHNYTSGSLDPASGSFRVTVIQF